MASPIRRGETPTTTTVSHPAPEAPGGQPVTLDRWRDWTSPATEEGRTTSGWPYKIERPEAIHQNALEARFLPLNAAGLVYPVDLSGDALHLINPQWSATRFLARLLSVKRWRLSGDIEGEGVAQEFDAGSRYSWSASFGESILPPATAFRGWLPFILSVHAEDVPGRATVEWELGLNVLAANAYTDEGRTQWTPQVFAAAGMSGGRPVVGPPISGRFRYITRGAGEDRPVIDAGEWLIQSAPPSTEMWSLDLLLPVDVLPVKIAGFQLIGWRRTHYNWPATFAPFTKLPGGELHLDPVSFWGPDEWRD